MILFKSSLSFNLNFPELPVHSFTEHLNTFEELKIRVLSKITCTFPATLAIELGCLKESPKIWISSSFFFF